MEQQNSSKLKPAETIIDQIDEIFDLWFQNKSLKIKIKKIKLNFYFIFKKILFI